MSDRTSHRRHARRQRKLEARADIQSVPCPTCGRPSLSYECFVTCTRTRRALPLMTDVPNWQHMTRDELEAALREMRQVQR